VVCSFFDEREFMYSLYSSSTAVCLSFIISSVFCFKSESIFLEEDEVEGDIENFEKRGK